VRHQQNKTKQNKTHIVYCMTRSISRSHVTRLLVKKADVVDFGQIRRNTFLTEANCTAPSELIENGKSLKNDFRSTFIYNNTKKASLYS
jgi:hypothetical protein